MTKVIRKRAVIRNREGFYLKQDGEWTQSFTEAVHFSNAMAAIETKKRFQLKNVELVLMPNAMPSKFDVVIPMSDSNEETKP